MQTERFNEIRETVNAFAWYNYEIEFPLASVENYYSYNEDDIVLVAECAQITTDEAVQFLDEIVRKAVDDWYAAQPPFTSQLYLLR